MDGRRCAAWRPARTQAGHDRPRLLVLLDRRVADALNLGAQARHAGVERRRPRGRCRRRPAGGARRAARRPRRAARRPLDRASAASCATPERVFVRSSIRRSPTRAIPGSSRRWSAPARPVRRRPDGGRGAGARAGRRGDRPHASVHELSWCRPRLTRRRASLELDLGAGLDDAVGRDPEEPAAPAASRWIATSSRLRHSGMPGAFVALSVTWSRSTRRRQVDAGLGQRAWQIRLLLET